MLVSVVHLKWALLIREVFLASTKLMPFYDGDAIHCWLLLPSVDLWWAMEVPMFHFLVYSMSILLIHLPGNDVISFCYNLEVYYCHSLCYHSRVRYLNILPGNWYSSMVISSFYYLECSLPWYIVCIWPGYILHSSDTIWKSVVWLIVHWSLLTLLWYLRYFSWNDFIVLYGTFLWPPCSWWELISDCSWLHWCPDDWPALDDTVFLCLLFLCVQPGSGGCALWWKPSFHCWWERLLLFIVVLNCDCGSDWKCIQVLLFYSLFSLCHRACSALVLWLTSACICFLGLCHCRLVSVTHAEQYTRAEAVCTCGRSAGLCIEVGWKSDLCVAVVTHCVWKLISPVPYMCVCSEEPLAVTWLSWWNSVCLYWRLMKYLSMYTRHVPFIL